MKLLKSISVIALSILTLWINSPITHTHQDSHHHEQIGLNNGHSIEHCYLCDQMLQSAEEAIQVQTITNSTYAKYFISNSITATDLLISKALKDRAPPVI